VSSGIFLVEAEAEAEAPGNMPLPHPPTSKVAIRILVDFCRPENCFQILFKICRNYVPEILFFF
jgi:hypothetical protein